VPEQRKWATTVSPSSTKSTISIVKSGEGAAERADPASRRLGERAVGHLVEDRGLPAVDALLDEQPDELLPAYGTVPPGCVLPLSYAKMTA
jgi:hypothetical protein